MSDSGSSSAGVSKTHRPILLSAQEVTIAEGDSRFAVLSNPTPPRLYSFAIEASHPLTRSWPLIRSRVLTILGQSRIRWSSLGALRRRQTSRQAGDDTTVVLVVEKGNNMEIVEKVEEGIYQACCSAGNPELFVEVLVGGVIRFAKPKYEVKASGGSSLSLTEVDYASGSLGGYVRLMGANGSRVFALSCHHVIMPASLDTPNEYPAAVAPGQGHHIRVSQPSVLGRAEHISMLEKEELRHGGNVKRLREQVEYEPWRVRELEMMEDMVRITSNKLQTALDFDPHFGTVFATSGYKISATRRCSLDWALVDISDTRRGENKVPEMMGEPLEYEFLSEGDAVVEVAELTLDDYVVKAGYATNTTYGTVSHIQHDCNIPGNSSTTSEYVVVGHKGKAFALGGDSGAFVLNSYGKLVGLLIAGHETLDAVLVTPITEVMQDIQQVTGHQVTLP
ncbi:MAG: hypothetical protein M1839_002099 [Geoglossum umbratile]|nr:MAG: hypothetical protein M1839_002099 [Geoglossum umbratile]